MDMLWDAVRRLPDSFPFASTLKNVSRALASESPGNLNLDILEAHWSGAGLHNEKCALISSVKNPQMNPVILLVSSN